MSFKIFSLQLTGKIKPVSTIEKNRKALADDYKLYREVESSEELKAFLQLKELLESNDFKQNKKTIQDLSFKGSEEEKQLKEFTRLKKSARIKKYFSVDGSSDLKRYEAEKDGPKMTDYYALKKYMKEGQFEKEKKEIKGQVFKGSEEEKHIKHFKRLAKSAGIKAFMELHKSDVLIAHLSFAGNDQLLRFYELKKLLNLDKERRKELKALKHVVAIKRYVKFERSKKFKLYVKTKGSKDLIKYEELKTYISTGEFKTKEAYLKDKKKFEKSEAFKKQNEFKKLKADDTVKFVLKYEKSKLYKNYLEVKDSAELKRYFELDEILQSEEYKKQKAWLEDKKRWEKTEEFKKEQQYEQEKTKPGFVNYFKYKDTDDFDFFKNWELVFNEEFSDKQLNANHWGTCTPTADKLLGENYAMPGDISFFTNGENIKLDKKLCITVKSEKAKGKIWQMPAGFVPGDFEYTSGLINSGGKFEMEDGILEAKISFNPVKQVVSSFYLSGDESTPRVNLVEMGLKNNVGISTVNKKGKIENSGLDISNLKRGSYIFTLEKSGANFTWKINETEVWNQAESKLNAALQFTASTMVIEKFSGKSDFEIEWVKCYRKK